MDSARSWLQKLQPRDKLRASTKRKEDNSEGNGDPDVQGSAEALSNVTKQKVAAAKQYIENHYKEQMKNLQERKERRNILEKKLADADVSEEDQNNLLKFLEKKETEYMRLQRHKMGADDFELLTMIGKGAFGEVEILAPGSGENISHYSAVSLGTLCARLRFRLLGKGALVFSLACGTVMGSVVELHHNLHMSFCASTKKVVGKVVPFCFVVLFEG